jgi:hypothetical protein
MEKHPTPREVLAELAGRGEPSAFMTLFGPLLHHEYDALKSAGFDEPKAQNTLSDFALRLYRSYACGGVGSDFEPWYAKQRRRHLPHTGEGDTQTVAASPEERERLERRVERAVLRAYTESHTGSTSTSPPTVLKKFLLRHRRVRNAAIAVAAVALAVFALRLCLVSTGTAVGVTVTRQGREHRYTFPSGTRTVAHEAAPVAEGTDAVDTVAQRPDTLAKAADTTVAEPEAVEPVARTLPKRRAPGEVRRTPKPTPAASGAASRPRPTRVERAPPRRKPVAPKPAETDVLGADFLADETVAPEPNPEPDKPPTPSPATDSAAAASGPAEATAGPAAGDTPADVGDGGSDSAQTGQ